MVDMTLIRCFLKLGQHLYYYLCFYVFLIRCLQPLIFRNFCNSLQIVRKFQNHIKHNIYYHSKDLNEHFALSFVSHINLIMYMEKFKTLNNSMARQVIRNACSGNARAVYIFLYNSHDCFTDEVYHRICTIVGELTPLTLDVYNTLPIDVQNYYNLLWLQS